MVSGCSGGEVDSPDEDILGMFLLLDVQKQRRESRFPAAADPKAVSSDGPIPVSASSR